MRTVFSEGEYWDRFKGHIDRSKGRYFAGAVGLFAGKHLLDKYAENPDRFESKVGNYYNTGKNVVKNTFNSAKQSVEDYDKKLKFVGHRFKNKTI